MEFGMLFSPSIHSQIVNVAEILLLQSTNLRARNNQTKEFPNPDLISYSAPHIDLHKFLV